MNIEIQEGVTVGILYGLFLYQAEISSVHRIDKSHSKTTMMNSGSIHGEFSMIKMFIIFYDNQHLANESIKRFYLILLDGAP